MKGEDSVAFIIGDALERMNYIVISLLLDVVCMGGVFGRVFGFFKQLVVN